jgi:hypothetical protein
MAFRFRKAFVLYLLLVPSSSLSQQTTSGYCSPAISNVNGNVTTNCYATKAKWQQSIEDNLQQAIFETQRLSLTQRAYLMASMQRYVGNPTVGNWDAAKKDVDRVQFYLAETIDAVLDYDSSLGPTLGDDLAELNDALQSRGGLISELPVEPPPAQYVSDWVTRYRQQMKRLANQLDELRERVHSNSAAK